MLCYYNSILMLILYKYKKISLKIKKCLIAKFLYRKKIKNIYKKIVKIKKKKASN